LDHRWVWSVQFTPDGRKLLLGGERASLVVHDLPSGNSVNVPLKLKYSGVYCQVSPDGKSFIAGQVDTLKKPPGWLVCAKMANPTTPVWSITTERYISAKPLFLANGNEFLLFEGHSEPFEYYVVCTRRKNRTGKLVKETRDAAVGSPIQSPDRRLVAGRQRAVLEILKADDLSAAPVSIKNDGKKEFTGLAFHPSGRYLAATSNDQTVKLYDTATWKVKTAFDWKIGRLRSVAFSPDGMRAAAGGDSGKIVVWDVDL